MRLSLLSFGLLAILLSFLALAASDAGKEPAPVFTTPESAPLPSKEVAKRKLPFEINAWVDSVYASMSDTQRLGQLFMVAAFSTTDKPDTKLEKLVRDYHLGGLIFMKGSPVRQAQLTNHYQALARVPLLIAMDAEWGLAMRLDSTIKYPYQMTLGAMTDNRLIYEMGRQKALQCQRLGVHVSFSPVVDVNNNPANPVISFRSFGEDKYKVAEKGTAYMRGLQDNRILACAKHFPGHGDTDADSHYSLPVVKASRKQLDTLELVPFKRLIREGVGSVMVAHLAIPALDTTTNQASTLSNAVVSKLLKEELGFEGLVFTDALNMKGVADFYAPGEVDARALLAGNDVLLYSMDVPVAMGRIFADIEAGNIRWRDIEKRVKRILAVKYWVGLNAYQPVNTNQLYEELNPAAAGALNQRIFEQAVTLVNNPDKLVPLRGKSNTKRLHLGVGDPTAAEFYNALSIYTVAEHRYLPMKYDTVALNKLAAELGQFDEVVVSWHLATQRAGQKFGIDSLTVAGIKTLLQGKSSVQVVFGNAYSLPQFNFGNALVCGYEEHPWAWKTTAQLLFGVLPFKGKLPVSVSPGLPAGTGLFTQAGFDLRLIDPGHLGLTPRDFRRIDSIANNALLLGAMPGAQLLLARGHEVFYMRSYGFMDQQRTQPVTQATVYDLASLTKVLATGVGTMLRYDQKLLPIDSSLGFFLPELKGTALGQQSLRALLAHQAGLPAFVPFWKRTFKNGKPDPAWYTDSTGLRVAEGLYARPLLADSLFQWVLQQPLQPGKYVYSDLGLQLAWEILERGAGASPERWLQNQLYDPLQLRTLGYQPRQRLPLALIAPTENEADFRKQLLHGDVHDPMAALQGGVAGHAGLFANAADVVRLATPLARRGLYGKKQYIAAETITLFTSPQLVNNRRGLLWDRPETTRGKASPVGPLASAYSFGHSGFTGTLLWIDPQTDLTFIFLSNRVHPSATPNRLAELNVRTQLLDEALRMVKQAAELPAPKSKVLVGKGAGDAMKE